MKDQRDRRREYLAPGLTRASLAADPLQQFQRWLQDAIDADLKDATAMALATVGVGGVPSVRIVLLKHFDAHGFCWYSDYRSQKGVELAENPQATCLLHWREFDRQVRITGAVGKLDAETSARYFASRPPDSRFSAAASRQSAVVDSRETLEQRVAELKQRHPDGAVPKPDQWGGYVLRPASYEFWQGRPGRLHDRFRFTRGSGGAQAPDTALAPDTWRIERLQP